MEQSNTFTQKQFPRSPYARSRFTLQSRKCVICGNSFQPNTSRSYCCSPECSQKRAIKRNTENRRELNIGARLGLSGGKIGKINQYIVAIDLLKKGWEVYTAFEDTHPFDLLCIRGYDLKKVEVKSATILPGGKRIIADPKGKVKSGKYEIVASVDNFKNIVYQPISFNDGK